MNRTLIPFALVPLLALAACGTETSTVSPSSGPPATTAPADPATGAAATPSAAAPAGLRPPTSTKEIAVDRTTGAPPTVTGARFAEHPGFDRVVIDLEGDLPGYSARWVSKLVQDGSGDPIDVKGGAYLHLTMTPANAHTETGTPTWTGGPIFQARLGNVRSVVRTGDFEAVVGVGVVLERKAAFRVLEQKSPNRLVVDIAH
ncbi:hypothetical protein [Streptosporangium sp. NPDC023615]|uniref:AMIN-like domain-containing (lipo)protein n=1 Tax=Streptosporangium sp. NPDC023615 TaxID=3154794 RepID=UPI00343018AB